MKASRIVRVAIILALAAAGLWLPAVCGMSPARAEFPNMNCASCHADAVRDVKTAGGRHRAVPCTGCHLGHPPDAGNALQSCNRCHPKTKSAHFELGGCLGCHKNPHTPLNISFSRIKGACVSCHAAQVEQLREHRSRHSALECSACHDIHRKVPECTRCHKPHSGDMIAADCRYCHRAHQPLPVTYASDVPSKDCGACHRKALDLLDASASKHRELGCAFCHAGRHKTVPACRDCHGSPHPEDIMARFPVCGRCHSVAHDLNHWTESQPANALQKSAKKL
jgi:hypothetical protein